MARTLGIPGPVLTIQNTKGSDMRKHRRPDRVDLFLVGITSGLTIGLITISYLMGW